MKIFRKIVFVYLFTVGFYSLIGQSISLKQADSLFISQDYFGSLNMYTELYALDTSNKIILNSVAESYYQLGDYANAKKHYHSLEESSEFKIYASAKLASIYESQQNLPKAIKYFTYLSTSFPSNPTYYRKLGNLYQQGNEPGQALSSYSRANALNPRDLLTIQSLVEIYLNTDQIEKADSFATVGVQVDSMNIGLKLLQSRILYKKRDYSGVANILHQLTYQTELNNYYNKLLGYAFMQIDSLDKAIYHLRKSLLNEGNPEYANFYLAVAFEKKKEYNESKHFYEQALKSGISENVAQYHKGLARMFANTNKYKDVIFHYKESLRYEEDANAYFYLANASEQYYKDKSIALDYYKHFVGLKGINVELEVIANQRIKALKEQAFMRKK